jgi:hypothetical protein
LDEGKRYPEKFDSRAIGIHMGDNQVSVWSDSAESQITNYRLVDGGEAEVAEKGKAMLGERINNLRNALQSSPSRQYLLIRMTHL